MANPSKAKGRAGENEFAKRIGSKRVPLSGAGEDRADVYTDGTLYHGYHVEVKRRKALACVDWYEQAVRAADDDFYWPEVPVEVVEASGKRRVPVVAMREDRGDWLVLIAAHDFEDMLVELRFLRSVAKARKERDPLAS